jgi:hypothetical protein
MKSPGDSSLAARLASTIPENCCSTWTNMTRRDTWKVRTELLCTGPAYPESSGHSAGCLIFLLHSFLPDSQQFPTPEVPYGRRC